MSDIVRRLRNPPFGTETSERNLMAAAADEIERLRAPAPASLVAVDPGSSAPPVFVSAETPSPVPLMEGSPAILKGVCHTSGDGWKDTNKRGDVAFVWNAEHSKPYSPGQFPRVGNAIYAASTESFSFTPATVDDIRQLIDDAFTGRRTWHATVETMCVLLGINGNGSPTEIMMELQAKLSEPAPDALLEIEEEIARIVQSVNEWDDRTSPDDYPEHLLITSEELAGLLRNFAAALSAKEGSE